MADQILLTRVTPVYWRVTFAHPPLNIFGPETIPELSSVITALESDNEVKGVVFDANSLPADSEIAPEWDAFLAALGRPAAQSRIKKLFDRGFHQPGDVETRRGHHLGLLGQTLGNEVDSPTG